MDLNWHTEETIRWCWNTPYYKSWLTEIIHNKNKFTVCVTDYISEFNAKLPDDMAVDASKVDMEFVHAKFCQLLNVPYSQYDLPLPDIDFLDDFDDVEELKRQNIQYNRNEDCIDCRQCFVDDLDVCIWDDSQIVSITSRRYENEEWIEHTITDEDEIQKYCEEERKKEKEAKDRQWKRDLIRDLYQNNK